jgi:TolA-binding protein
MRLYLIEHQFGSGLLVGSVAGVAAVIIVLVALFGGRLERDEPLVREEDNDAATAMAGDGLTPDQPRASDEPRVTDKPKASGKSTAPGMSPAQAGPRDKPRTTEATEIAEPAGSEKRSTSEQTIHIPEGLSRKRLRRWLIEAFAEERFAEALAVGLHMAERRQLDWESRFALAEAARLAGRPEVALEHYQAFIDLYPPANIYMDDAQFWAAKLLAGQRRFGEARKLFSAVAKNPTSNLRRRAQKRLAELPK